MSKRIENIFSELEKLIGPLSNRGQDELQSRTNKFAKIVTGFTLGICYEKGLLQLAQEDKIIALVTNSMETVEEHEEFKSFAWEDLAGVRDNDVLVGLICRITKRIVWHNSSEHKEYLPTIKFLSDTLELFKEEIEDLECAESYPEEK